MSETAGTIVAQRAADVAHAARDGADWLEVNHERLHVDPAAMAHSFRRFARRANRLRQAAERPTAIAVFGASQAGKSYLVSGLAAPRGRPLIAAYDRERLNFLTDLNPVGGRESTGLVSRFTIRRVPRRRMRAAAAVAVPDRYRQDLANTFLEDFQIADLRLPGAQAVTEPCSGWRHRRDRRRVTT
jgi:hypothetical protein